ncbi:MAG: methyltransferase domain-containing protein [Tabrizicola sp.]|nr:methyltransferase domain-containing protein [Tabrizicola sp.]
MPVADWNPDLYAAFRGLRMRPALDLLAQVPALPEGEVVDLGCGDGAAAGALRQRFPAARMTGVDTSAAMLAAAQGYDATTQTDIADWWPEAPPALIFSNAALHWLTGHDRLLPRLAGMLVPGGVLAVQMPRQFGAPSHARLREIAAAMFPDRFDFRDWTPPVAAPDHYWRLLSPLGTTQVWETEYLQHLPPGDAHPVRRFTKSTAMRPFVERLSPPETAAFLAAYDEALRADYPLAQDGATLFPFRRLFLVLRRPP